MRLILLERKVTLWRLKMIVSSHAHTIYAFTYKFISQIKLTLYLNLILFYSI